MIAQLLRERADHGASGERHADSAASQHNQTQGGSVSGAGCLAGGWPVNRSMKLKNDAHFGNTVSDVTFDLCSCCRRTWGWWSISRWCRGRRRETQRNRQRETTQQDSKEASRWKWREKEWKEDSSLFSETNNREVAADWVPASIFPTWCTVYQSEWVKCLHTSYLNIFVYTTYGCTVSINHWRQFLGIYTVLKLQLLISICVSFLFPDRVSWVLEATAYKADVNVFSKVEVVWALKNKLRPQT